jgi:hypothetical protein
MKALFEEVEKSEEDGGDRYEIDGAGTEDSHYNPDTGKTHWNPNMGVQGTDSAGNQGELSPAMVLGHELAHAVEHKTNQEQFNSNRRNPYPPGHKDKEGNSDGQYDNPEEKRAIKKIECPCAKKLGELQRNSHKGSRLDGKPTVPGVKTPSRSDLLTK